MIGQFCIIWYRTIALLISTLHYLLANNWLFLTQYYKNISCFYDCRYSGRYLVQLFLLLLLYCFSYYYFALLQSFWLNPYPRFYSSKNQNPLLQPCEYVFHNHPMFFSVILFYQLLAEVYKTLHFLLVCYKYFSSYLYGLVPNRSFFL